MGSCAADTRPVDSIDARSARVAFRRVVPNWIESGAVFVWPHDDRPKRVLIHCDGVVMYDAWWPHNETWGLADLKQAGKKRVSYYVARAATLIGTASHLRKEPLSDDEFALHRPDLPFAVAQSAAMQWPTQTPPEANRRTDLLTAAGCVDAWSTVNLGAAAVYLYPFGPNGGHKAGIRAEADNRTDFTAEELFWKAATIQAPSICDVLPTHGVGIYRSGLQRGIPSYYLWGNQSRLHVSPESSSVSTR